MMESSYIFIVMRDRFRESSELSSRFGGELKDLPTGREGCLISLLLPKGVLHWISGLLSAIQDTRAEEVEIS